MKPNEALPPAPEGDLACVWVVGAAILSRGSCLVARRLPGGSAGGLWEFPGGKIRPGESAPAALEREIREELALSVEVEKYLGRGEAKEVHRRIVLDVFVCRALEPVKPTLSAHSEWKWIRPDEITTLAFAQADVPLLSLLRAECERPEPQSSTEPQSNSEGAEDQKNE